MDPITASAAITAGTKLVSNFFGNKSAKHAAKQQYKYQKALQDDAQEFAKWQMGNAHQMEVQDLEAAGLNKILSAGGSGASAGVSAGSAQMANTQAPDLSEAVNTALQAKTADALVKKTEAETGKTTVEAYKTLIDAGYSEASISKAEAERALILQEIENAKTSKELMEAEKKIKEWDARHPLISRMLPATSAVAGGVIGGMSAGALKNFTWTKPRKIGFNR